MNEPNTVARASDAPSESDYRRSGPAGLVTTRELAEILKLSDRQIRRLDSAGKLPAAVHVGGAKRWRSDEIDAWIRASCPDRVAWSAIQATAQRRRSV